MNKNIFYTKEEVKDMDINRNALLLYLRDLRDLEIAKKKISALYSKEKEYMESNLAYMKTPNLQVENDVPDYSVGFMMLGLGLVMALFFGWMTLSVGIGFFAKLLKLIFGVLTGMGVFMAIAGLFGIVHDDREVSKSNKEAKKHNAEEKARVENNADLAVQMEREYKQTLSYLNSEYSKADSLLTAYYNQNLLPKQYRNLPSLIYIYDYMSTSQESFSDTLIHEHMENGIQKILSKLDYIIQQNEYMIFNQHRIESQNQSMISQNQSMLESLERTEHNTFESKQYAQLSLNYSKATAFFAAAIYLEQR